MNKELEVFENRSDDWLAKERKHEEKVSAWDLDEGKKIKYEHEQQHVTREEIQAMAQKSNRTYASESYQQTRTSSRQAKQAVSVITIVSLIIVFVFMTISTTFMFFFFEGGGPTFVLIPFVFVVIMICIAAVVNIGGKNNG